MQKFLLAIALSALISPLCKAAPAPDTTVATSAPAPDDRFIAGYASAILEHEFKVVPQTILVDGGDITLSAKDLGALDRDRITAALQQIRGVRKIKIVDGAVVASPVAPAPVVPGGVNEPAPAVQPAPGGSGVETQTKAAPWTLLSPLNVFQPLVADPRWPDFSAAYERYSDSGRQKLRDVGSVSFGESLSLYQSSAKPSGQFELGIQAAVFAIFDLNSSSKDLVNADYFVGPILEYRKDNFSGFVRVYHQSSHLGDEFLLANPGITRVNLSYEAVDAVASYDLFDKTLRVYAGGGYLVDVDPSDLKPGLVHYGIEYRGPRIFPSVGMTPIVAVDMQNRQYSNWSLDLSARAGVQFEDAATLGRKVQLLIEYYNGHSPNGQFYTDRIEYIGLDLHFYP